MAYCVPYGYLAMKGDAISGTMLFYGFMIAAFGLLYGMATKTNSRFLLIIGTILSFISSYLFTLRNLTEEWSWYFKPFTPFTPTSLLILLTMVSFMLQIVLIFGFSKSKKFNGG